ncbi:MAG: thiamine pyrophosphate-dependent enzyme [Kineosporiaceae bacterium]
MSPAAVELTGPGPGDDLVAHLVPVLAGLGAPGADPSTAGTAGPASPACLATEGHRADAESLVAILDAQMASRWLDVAARRMRALGEGFYTIGSAGHEANAAVALALRPTDPALLHYRSGAFYLARSAQAGRRDGVHDVAIGLAAGVDEPIAGGRHKVFGHPDLAVVPLTSTIASHLPRALGVAWALGRTAGLPARMRTPLRWPDDAVVVASFGDASANHSTATGAVNAACWGAHQGARLPLLLVCEDNGLGISVRTPHGWVQAMYGSRPGLEYRFDDGTDPLATLAAARAAVATARDARRPVLLHLRTVRIGGHAGSDVEGGYRTPAEIAADLAADPLAATMRAVVEANALTPNQVRTRWQAARDLVTDEVDRALDRARRPGGRLTGYEQVMAPISPRRPGVVAQRAGVCADRPTRHDVFGARLPEDEGGLTLAQAINRTLLDAGALDPRLVVLGEDVGRKGGVYGVTRGLQRRLGASRVVDTLLDEQTVLGMALGAGMSGLLPVPEIQYLAYLHNAEDQLRGEAATMQFFSQGAYRNPLVVRVQGLAYQKGFGGHFHNDNALGVLGDVPGLVVACPAHPSDAPALLRTCLAAADADGTVCVVVEPIALYHERDMLTPGDGAWLAPYAPPEAWGMGHVPVGRAATWGAGTDVTIATFGNGLRMSLRAAAALEREGVGVRVVDLRWLRPLPVDDVVREARTTGRLLVVDETRRTGGISEGLLTGILEAGFQGRVARVCAEDSFVPLGDAADLVLVQQADVESAVRLLLA